MNSHDTECSEPSVPPDLSGATTPSGNSASATQQSNLTNDAARSGSFGASRSWRASHHAHPASAIQTAANASARPKYSSSAPGSLSPCDHR